MIHDSLRGSVFLEPIRNRSLEATHPITLDTGVIARALRGIQVRDDRNTLQVLLGSRPEPVRAFSDEEADFLAPFISTAFAKASRSEEIGFRINQAASLADPQQEGTAPAPSGSTEPPAQEAITSGILLAYGRSLQIHLTQFRSGIPPRSLIDGPNRHYADRTGLTGRKLAFVPKEAERPETFRVGETEFPTLVLDYDRLGKLPEQLAAPPPMSPPTAGPDQPTTPSPSTTQEIESLRKELQEIKQQLKEQQSGREGSRSRDKLAR
jgi:hypothetical protein